MIPQAITGRQFTRAGVAFVCGLIPYIQLPLSAHFSKSPSTWGNHKTISGMYHLITLIFTLIEWYYCAYVHIVTPPCQLTALKSEPEQPSVKESASRVQLHA